MYLQIKHIAYFSTNNVFGIFFRQLHLAGQNRKGNDDLMITDFVQVSRTFRITVEVNYVYIMQLDMGVAVI